MSRKECSAAVKHGRISVNGKTASDSAVHIDPQRDKITLDGEDVQYMQYVYVMLNKPTGYVSSTDEPNEHTVLELLSDNIVKMGVFPCGRLDKDTTGLMILTSDGDSCHRALAPKSHVCKKYYFECADCLTGGDISKMINGITLADGYTTLPCEIEQLSEKSGVITLREGKYHQIKRMFGAVGNKITALKRVSFGDIQLDEGLLSGQWRYLTEEEIKSFTAERKM